LPQHHVRQKVPKKSEKGEMRKEASSAPEVCVHVWPVRVLGWIASNTADVTVCLHEDRSFQFQSAHVFLLV